MTTALAQKSAGVKKQLGEVVDFVDGDRGKNYPKQNEFFDSGYCLFLSTKNVPKNSFSFEEKMFVTEEKDNQLRKGKLLRGDYVLTTRGTVGNFAYYNEKIPFENVRINSGMVILRVKSDDLNRDYLKFYLESSSFMEQVNGRVSGSAQPQLPIRDMLTMDIDLPDIKTQAGITSVLSAYDDLIENNEKRIKALEEMAQLLYNEWFVKFKFPGHEKAKMLDSGSECGMIPEGWKIKKFGEVIELAYGKALKGENRTEGNVLVYGSSGLVGTHNEKLVNGPGIVVGRKGNAGAVHWVDDDFYPIDTTYYVKSNLDLHFIYYLLKNHGFVMGDVAVPGLNRNQTYLNAVLLPPAPLITAFSVRVSHIFNLVSSLSKKNLKLGKMRDLLIPQLVTGKRTLK